MLFLEIVHVAQCSMFKNNTRDTHCVDCSSPPYQSLSGSDCARTDMGSGPHTYTVYLVYRTYCNLSAIRPFIEFFSF